MQHSSALDFYRPDLTSVSSIRLGVFSATDSSHWPRMAERDRRLPTALKMWLTCLLYRPLASLAVAAKAGAKLTHVDASKRSIGLGKGNPSHCAGAPTKSRSAGFARIADEAFIGGGEELRGKLLRHQFLTDRR